MSPSRLILSAGIPVRFDKASNSFSKSTSSSPVTSGIWNLSRGIKYGWIWVGSYAWAGSLNTKKSFVTLTASFGTP